LADNELKKSTWFTTPVEVSGGFTVLFEVCSLVSIDVVARLQLQILQFWLKEAQNYKIFNSRTLTNGGNLQF